MLEQSHSVPFSLIDSLLSIILSVLVGERQFSGLIGIYYLLIIQTRNIVLWNVCVIMSKRSTKIKQPTFPKLNICCRKVRTGLCLSEALLWLLNDCYDFTGIKRKILSSCFYPAEFNKVTWVCFEAVSFLNSNTLALWVVYWNVK